VQEQRLLSAAVEHERVAPLQPRDHLAFTRLFRHQITNGFLLQRLRRSSADVDPFSRRARVTQHAWMDQMVVHDHIGRGEALQAP
jgi:hypothetical protein